MRKSAADYTREWREANPVRAAYLNLKNNAKRRGKDFTLTFEEFSEFAVRNKIVYSKKRTKNTFSIDRIDHTKGYSLDNIQVLTLSENSQKQHREFEFRIFEWFDNYQDARIKPNHKPQYKDSPF